MFVCLVELIASRQASGHKQLTNQMALLYVLVRTECGKSKHAELLNVSHRLQLCLIRTVYAYSIITMKCGDYNFFEFSIY